MITDADRLNANKVKLINQTHALRISPGGLYADRIPPKLTSFSLDLDNDVLDLEFNEPVRVSSIIYEYITIISKNVSGPSDEKQLEGGEIDDETNFNGTEVISIHLTQADIRYLKLSEKHLATSELNTFISVKQGMILDMNDNKLVAIPYTEAIPVETFTPDETPARLIDFELDMNLGLIHLTFNDIINSSTLYAPGITLQNSKSIDKQNSVTLTQSSITESLNDYYITINISASDLNLIKFNDELGTDLSNTYLSMRAETFKDNFGVDIFSVTSHKALKAFSHIEDITVAVLDSFVLDMNTGIIHLTFDETVRANTIIEEEIILIGGPNISENSYVQLQAGVASTTNSPMIDVYIPRDDLNLIKFYTDLGTSEEDTYIAFSSQLINDMNGNSVASISDMDAKQAEYFIQDITKPILLSFRVNLTENTLTLSFNETVDASTLQASEITVQGHQKIVLEFL